MTSKKDEPRPGWWRIGEYHVGHVIGSGMAGPCVYDAEGAQGGRVAVKWPTTPEEVEALLAIQSLRPGGCLGVPAPLGFGHYKDRPYLVLDRYRWPLSEVLPRIRWQSPEKRWRTTSIIGRLLLRRLEALHRCGYVHCDMSPENILLGRHDSVMEYAPHVVDFGLARPYPGGGPMAGALGSAEWSSIRSAESGERRPEDDLEALGWVLVNCIFDSLPWMPELSAAYPVWHDEEVRERAIRGAQRAKRQLLDDGWESLGAPGRHLEDLPSELYRYLQACRHEVELPQRPDYEFLALLLGGRLGGQDDLDAQEVDAQDRKLLQTELGFHI